MWDGPCFPAGRCHRNQPVPVRHRLEMASHRRTRPIGPHRRPPDPSSTGGPCPEAKSAASTAQQGNRSPRLPARRVAPAAGVGARPGPAVRWRRSRGAHGGSTGTESEYDGVDRCAAAPQRRRARPQPGALPPQPLVGWLPRRPTRGLFSRSSRLLVELASVARPAIPFLTRRIPTCPGPRHLRAKVALAVAVGRHRQVIASPSRKPAGLAGHEKGDELSTAASRNRRALPRSRVPVRWSR